MGAERWVATGAVSAALAVGLGAFGAHILEGRLDAKHLSAYEVGVHYHLIHSLAIILVGILASRWQSRTLAIAGVLLLGGIALFSGGLYLWSLTQIRAVVHIVPLGGMSFVAGWIVLAIAALRR